jgi:hypothetical protein
MPPSSVADPPKPTIKSLSPFWIASLIISPTPKEVAFITSGFALPSRASPQILAISITPLVPEIRYSARVFIDGLRSPSIQTDGSESWGSYGWGFVCPPQCNPFSGYNGVPGFNDTWSELRLTLGDSYPFRSNLRFELEHGCNNDGGGFHSGQIFLYMQPKPAEAFLLETAPGDGNYVSDGKISPVVSRFENGIHYNFCQFSCVRGLTSSHFTVKIPSENDGLVLKRVSVQDKGRMCAEVWIDGVKVTGRRWLFPDCNTMYSFLEDSFCIPAQYTAGKTSATVEIRPLDQNWSECSYRVFALLPPYLSNK